MKIPCPRDVLVGKSPKGRCYKLYTRLGAPWGVVNWNEWKATDMETFIMLAAERGARLKEMGL